MDGAAQNMIFAKIHKKHIFSNSSQQKYDARTCFQLVGGDSKNLAILHYLCTKLFIEREKDKRDIFANTE